MILENFTFFTSKSKIHRVQFYVSLKRGFMVNLLKKMKQGLQNKKIQYLLITLGIIGLTIASNLYLQWSQNGYEIDLVWKFAFSWHTEKFFLGCFILLVFLLFLCCLAGSIMTGSLMYTVTIVVLGFADYQKLFYRAEPVYPDDLKMITELGLMREMVGDVPFFLILIITVVAIAFFCWGIYKSLFLPKKVQMIRVTGLILTIGLLSYISNFNSPNNLFRKEFDKTASWIPYSQQMNYYNNGFIGGFLYNLKVDPMAKPKNYSKEKIAEITKKYIVKSQGNQTVTSEKPNIIFIMSESFSNPQNLNGVKADKNPLANYYDVADKTYSGKMLSQNYGGGTANIEFEALTSFSMELFNPQMTTPYTMLVPKMKEIPSIVSLLKEQDYQTTAIHPYNTSMYKRKDVYNKLGFDRFIDETTIKYTSRTEYNPYISDKSAYQEVLDRLENESNPQFVHLVTMQTHMPYSGKYVNLDYSSTSKGNKASIDNFMQDVFYSSKALKEFTEVLKKVNRRTLVVFWGDHLPGIYSDEIKKDNEEVSMHETEFLIFDNQGKLEGQNKHDNITSPFYFAPTLFKKSGLQTTGFYQLLSELSTQVPAFEKGFYYQNNQWSKDLKLNKKQEELYEEYRMIQYDIVAGEKYSLKTNFFKE